MKKNILSGFFVFFVLLLLSSAILISCQQSKSSFVTVDNGNFMLEGKPFRFIGTNNYYMHYESNAMIDDVITQAKDMGVKVIRIWGFFNGMSSNNEAHNAYMQPSPGVYGLPDEGIDAKNCYERLDYTIAAAKEAGIKVVLVLNNNWDDFGGANTYVEWAGKTGHDLFFSDESVKTMYKEYVNNLINRKNTYTQTLYKDEPTIMTWELMNEPRCESDPTGETLLRWTEEMSTYIKSLAPKQLVALGDEGFFNRKGANGFFDEGEWAYSGFSGVDWDRLIALENIDYGTFHLYPEHWGVPENIREQWGTKYILDHLEAGKIVNKPVVLEEYGISSAGNENRLAIYDVWNKVMLENGGAGSMFWILTGINDKELNNDPPGDGIYDDYDGFRVMNDNSEVSQLLKKYALKFSGTQSKAEIARAYLMAPAKAQDVKDVYKVYVKVVTEDEEVDSVEAFADGKSIGMMNYDKLLDNYYIRWDTTKYQDGKRIPVKGIVTLKDGKILETAEIEMTISNTVTYSLYKTFDFSESTQGAVSEGAYQAVLKAIKYSALNGGMLEVEAKIPGKYSWEELKIKFPAPDFEEIGQCSKITFDIYYRKSIADSGASTASDKTPGTNPYIAFEPGWHKQDLDKHTASLDKLEVVVLDDNMEYYLQHVEIEYFKNSSYTGFAICPVFNLISYEGPIYLDNIALYKKD